MRPDPWSRRMGAYYLGATPLFALVDGVLGAPIRVAGLASPGLRAGYYLILVLVGVFLLLRPSMARWIVMGESVVNLFLLLLSVLLPIWSLPEVVLAGGDPEPPFSAVGLLNVLLVGGVLIWTFHENAWRVLAPPPSAR